MKKLFLTLLCLLALAGNGWGATYYVKPAATYPAGVDSIGTPAEPYDTAAKAGDIRTVWGYANTNASEAAIVILLAGTHDLSIPNWSYYVWNNANNLTVQPDTGATAIVDGKGTEAFLYINANPDIVLEDFTIQNCTQGYPTISQICSIYKKGTGSLTLTNMTIKDASTPANGAALYALTGNLIISGGTFSGNESTAGKGGAIYFQQTPDVSISGATFTGNRAWVGGGAVCVGGNVANLDTEIADCIFTGNITEDTDSYDGLGGAIYVELFTGAFALTDSVFAGNSAKYAGGAIANYNTGANTIDGNTFTGNFVFGQSEGEETFQGGAVIFGNENVDAVITDNTFTGNYIAEGDTAGGALKLSAAAYATILRNTFTGNIASKGGAIDFGGSVGVACTSPIGYNLFIGNFASTGDGTGGAWNALALHTVNAYHNTYLNNAASEQGNAVSMGGEVTRTLTNEIYHNGGTDEIYNRDADGTLNIDYCYVQGGADAITAEDSYLHSSSDNPLLTSLGKLLSTSPAIDEGAWITGINDGGESDPWGKGVYRLPNIGADQGADIPRLPLGPLMIP